MVVLSGPPNQETATVYRRSSSAPGKFSVERYRLVNGAWGPRQKDREKLSVLPDQRASAVGTVVDGIQCWTEAL